MKKSQKLKQSKLEQKNMENKKEEVTSEKSKPELKPSVKMLNGSAFFFPPENLLEEKEEEKEVYIDQTKDVVTVSTQSDDVENIQYVYDKETEKLSKMLNEKVATENEERVEKVKAKLEVKKCGSSFVVSSTSFDDIDLSIIDNEKK